MSSKGKHNHINSRSQTEKFNEKEEFSKLDDANK